MKNYYEMLGVSYTSTKEEIKKAYLAMLKQYHPDVFKGNKQIAQDFTAQLNIAFDTLSDSEKRLAYDQSIFPPQLTNYIYDESGKRKILEQDLKQKNSKKFMPVFSFFGRSALSEKISKALKKSKAENKKHKNEIKQTKKLKNFAKKEKRKQLKKEKFQEKQKRKQFKKENKNKIKKRYSQEKLYKSSKRKLDVTIIIIASVLILFFGFMVYLYLTN